MCRLLKQGNRTRKLIVKEGDFMHYLSSYNSPLGKILLAADETGLTGLWFEGQKYFAAGLKAAVNGENPHITEAKRWLDIYFCGEKPDFTPRLHFMGTEFQNKVWQKLIVIPYGETITYGDIAKQIGSSARAVGSAVGHNKISIIVPCHRVLGSNGALTGYAGGLERKAALLNLEKEKR